MKDMQESEIPKSVGDKALFFKFFCLQLLLTSLGVAGGVIGGYIGLKTGEIYFETYFPLKWWPVQFTILLFGVSVYSAFYFKLVYFLKDKILSAVQFGAVYALSRDDCTTISGGIIGATKDFKETGGVVLAFSAVRFIFDKVKNSENKVSDFFKWMDEYDFLKVLGPLRGVAEFVVNRVLASMEMCVLAYVYRKDEDLLTELVNGIFVFVKQSPKIAKKVVSAVTTSVIIEVCGVFCIVWVYFKFVYFDVFAVLLLYLIIRIYLFIIQDAVCEPLVMYWSVEIFLKDIDSVGDLSDAKSALSEIVNVEEVFKKFNIDIFNKASETILGASETDFSEQDNASERQDIFDVLDDLM